MSQTSTLRLRLLYLCMCIYNIHVGSKYFLSGSFSAALPSAGIISKVSRDNNTQSNNNKPELLAVSAGQSQVLELGFARVFAPCPLLPADCSVWHRFICKDDEKSAGSHCTITQTFLLGICQREVAGVPRMWFCVTLGQIRVSHRHPGTWAGIQAEEFSAESPQHHPQESSTCRWHCSLWQGQLSQQLSLPFWQVGHQ